MAAAVLIFFSFSLLLLSFDVQLTRAMSTITAMAKDQISCTMCSSCDNPCQPIFSPPPSPLPPVPAPSSDVYNCPPPPSPPPPAPAPSSPDYNCPPPPSPPQSCPENCSQQPLSPPYGGDSGGGGDGNFYYPPTDPSVYPTPPPPNPILPYFPFYYYNQPSSNRVVSNSVQFKNHSFITCLILVVAIFLFL